MKESKFWIWFIPLFAIICVGIYILVSNANKLNMNHTENVVENQDSKLIKESYEKLNDESIKVQLTENNNYVLANKESIEKVFNTNGIIYFGEVSSYASRKNVSLLNDVVSSTSVSKIYYINIANVDDDFMSYLLNKLNVKKINAGDTYLIKDNNVIHSILAKDYDNDNEFTEKEKESLLNEYQEKILDLIEKCDESC